MTTGASTGKEKATMRIEGNTEREKGETITTRTEAAITGTIMRRNQEMTTGERRSSPSKRRKIVVIIDEMYGEIFCFRGIERLL